MRRRIPIQKDGNAESNDLHPKESPWNEMKLLLGCIAFRLVNALVVMTFFNPDEYWQSVEVAHRIVFGYGHLTWEWANGIRSYIHPLIFAALYKLLALINMDSRWLVVKAPRLLQAMIAAGGDFFLFRLAKHQWGEHAARWTIFCQLCNWFTFFCMVRTFSNCMETVLMLVALNYLNGWRMTQKSALLLPHASRQTAFFFAAVACALRPTSAIIWIYVGLLELFGTRKKVQFLCEVLCIGAIIFGINCLLDRWMYGKWIVVPLNFLKFNFFSSGADYYGTHPWHWYFSQGFPTMCFTFLPLSLLGMFWSKQWKTSGLVLWVLSAYSLLGHKEFRFVLPMLPLGLMFAGYALASMHQYQQSIPAVNITIRRRFWFKIMIIGLLATNVPMALYMSAVHQRGGEAVMDYLHKEISDGHAKSVIFLIPCHNTPYYSFLHANITMRFLDCTPSDEVGYVDEADRFLARPEDFVSGILKDPLQLPMPTHVVFFDSMEGKLRPLLQEHGYKQAARIFHAHFAVDHGLQKYLLVYRLPQRSYG